MREGKSSERGKKLEIKCISQYGAHSRNDQEIHEMCIFRRSVSKLASSAKTWHDVTEKSSDIFPPDMMM